LRVGETVRLLERVGELGVAEAGEHRTRLQRLEELTEQILEVCRVGRGGVSPGIAVVRGREGDPSELGHDDRLTAVGRIEKPHPPAERPYP
jgi:hypothetical protein